MEELTPEQKQSLIHDKITLNKVTEIERLSTIHPTQNVVDETRKWLTKLYKDVGYKGNIEDRVTYIIEKAIKGWFKAPKKFSDRVTRCVGNRTIAQWVRITKQDAVEKKIREIGSAKNVVVLESGNEPIEEENEAFNGAEPDKIQKEDKVVDKKNGLFLPTYLSKFDTNSEILKCLESDERKYWQLRNYQFRNEFEFNESSDKILLEQLLYIEVMLRRLRLYNLTGKARGNLDGLDEKKLMEDHRKSLEALGVLRVQRIDSDSNVEGNVGEISMLLDEKLNEIKQIKTDYILDNTLERINREYQTLTLDEIKELIEEHSLLRQISKEPELNPIPAAVYASILSKEKQLDEEDASNERKKLFLEEKYKEFEATEATQIEQDYVVEDNIGGRL